MVTLVSLSKRPIFILSFLLLTLICFLPTETLGDAPAFGTRINLSYERGETVDLGEAVFTENGLDLGFVSFNAFVASGGWYLVYSDNEDFVVGWAFVQDTPKTVLRMVLRMG